MKTGWIVLFALLCLAASGALAQTYTYGGSGEDVLFAVAAGPDGRLVMTGYTDSADGTLHSRTKTGRSGWALCVDTQGEVLWSFCSRNGSSDWMTAPVIREDGSVCVLLRNEDDGAWTNELIRLSDQGEELSRTMLQPGTGMIFSIVDGYAQSVYSDEHARWKTSSWFLEHEGYDDTLLYDADGALVGTLPAWTGAVDFASGRLSERTFEDSIWLYRREEDGSEAPFVRLADYDPVGLRPLHYWDMAELPDGGAAAGGWGGEWVSESERQTFGLLTRWDAQGRVLWEMRLMDGTPVAMEALDDGLVVINASNSRWEEDRQLYVYDYTLLRFDENGQRTGAVALGMGGVDSGCGLAVLEDGTVAAVFPEGAAGQEDARLTLVQPDA